MMSQRQRRAKRQQQTKAQENHLLLSGGDFVKCYDALIYN